jgi:hypothetical protein
LCSPCEAGIRGCLRVCRVFFCVRHGSSGAEKWTSVSPWSAVATAAAEAAADAATLGVGPTAAAAAAASAATAAAASTGSHSGGLLLLNGKAWPILLTMSDDALHSPQPSGAIR